MASARAEGHLDDQLENRGVTRCDLAMVSSVLDVPPDKDEVDRLVLNLSLDFQSAYVEEFRRIIGLAVADVIQRADELSHQGDQAFASAVAVPR